MRRRISIAVAVTALLLWIGCAACSHPHADMSLSWATRLRAYVAECDRVEVRTGGTCHRQKDQERVLFKVEGTASVSNLVGNIEVDETRSGNECGCCGSHTLEFYRGWRHVTSVGFHHCKGLRWEHWDGDARLTVRSEAALGTFMKAHGLRDEDIR